MRFSTLSLAALASFTCTVSALSPADWKKQSIYQVMTDRFARTDGSTTAACDTSADKYCGGSWQGIINKLDYIQDMGFTAIWISPIVENLQADGAYHGYWAQNITELNTNFGTESDLLALSTALHGKGMYLMVDVVTNHMGYNGCRDCVDYSIFDPFNLQSDYHTPCAIDYNNATSEKVCWEGDDTVSLPDLRTEDSGVLATWNTWIGGIVTKYSIDGLRLDSALEVDVDFFSPFEAAAGVYIVGEAFNGDPSTVCPLQDSLSGLLNYPAYYWITQAFESTSGSMSNLENGINTMKSECSDTNLLGSFLENHDVARFPSYTSDISLTKNAIAFTILTDGIPIVYEGQEQHFSGTGDPSSREAVWLSGYPTDSTFYTWIASLNQIRNEAINLDPTYVTYKANPIYSDSSNIVMRKGNTGFQMISAFTNTGASGSSSFTLSSTETGFNSSQALIEVMSCTAVTTDSSGNLAVTLTSGLPGVYFPKSLLTGSGICSSITGSKSSTSASASATTTAPSTTDTSSATATSTKTSKSASSSLTTSSVASSTSASCTTATSVAVTFNALESTAYGETIKLAGNTTALGSWAPANALALSAANYTASNPQWSVTVSMAPGTAVLYKFIKVGSGGSVAWEADPNRSYTVPVGCAAAAMVRDVWQA
ncbi:Alpha-amylase A type-3 [Lachnellula hyalina]|uniref:alpha-amylase n=1 Tax=Lachnellula hyalina TaxID=1316788 RepID=A0A8H8TVW3_9HELO|nr:Alpha-amylase A type-3 [Lachnellula hyalina]TVY22327.1 Alpha-amylase A type-3 [Lachnellula hyalina]